MKDHRRLSMKERKRPLKYCNSIEPYCNAYIKFPDFTLCCRYGWCEFVQPSQDRGKEPKLTKLA